MKKLAQAFLFIILIPGAVVAQQNVAARDIIAQINRGQVVAYQNATITGDLDLTQLNNKKLKEQSDKDDPSTQEYISTVTAPLQFTNCTFAGKVLAYFNPNQGMNFTNNAERNEIYNANFAQDVRFESCIFQQEAAFKYSQFKTTVSFAGSQFSDEALFKYTKFEQAPNFSRAKFTDGAVFKYVHFPAGTNFSQAVFSKEADFKYAKFPGDSNLERAQFLGSANFKYADFSAAVKLQGIAFKGATDFKYTQLGNRKFNEVFPAAKTE